MTCASEAEGDVESPPLPTGTGGIYITGISMVPYWMEGAILGLGIARYLAIQFNSLGLDSIQYRCDIDPIASISIQ